MGRFRDLTGQPFERLTVLHRDPDHSRGVRWVCRCQCGNVVTVASSDLTTHHTRSCGCLWKDTVPGNNTSHGQTGTYLYRVWGLMIQRCHNPANPAYPRYGGRGIMVCDAWRTSFTAFMQEMGQRPTAAHSLERRDNDGPYDSQNCYWATPIQQARNTRRNRHLTWRGETKTIAEWAEVTGISSWNIRQRLDRYGWTVEKALTTRNRSRDIFLTCWGETHTLTEWAALRQLPYATLTQRIAKLKWSAEKALTFPIQR